MSGIVTIEDLPRLRAERPQAVGEAAAARERPSSVLAAHGRVMIVAADHPARGILGAGEGGKRWPIASSRFGASLSRLRVEVNGVLGTPDVLKDLLLHGALQGKLRRRVDERRWTRWHEVRDRRPLHCIRRLSRAVSLRRKQAPAEDRRCRSRHRANAQAIARAVSALVENKLMALVELFICTSVASRLRNELSAEAVIRSISIVAALGTTSAYTWLKIPVVAEMERVGRATTFTCLRLGGEVTADQDATFASWSEALALPNVFGFVVGRSLLFPPDDESSRLSIARSACYNRHTSLESEDSLRASDLGVDPPCRPVGVVLHTVVSRNVCIRPRADTSDDIRARMTAEAVSGTLHVAKAPMNMLTSAYFVDGDVISRR
jgi:hypothetical protein